MNNNLGAGDQAKGPDFIGIGVQKSGTTWLADILAQHPGIMIRKKETDFFVRKFHRGYDWYNDLFADRGDCRAGELSPDYIISPLPEYWRKEFYPRWNFRRQLYVWRRTCPSARDEIHRRYPDVRLFAIFRNPIDRAWSAYWYWKVRKDKLKKPMTSFDRMWEEDGRWLRSIGQYADLVRFWQEKFPDLGVFFYDDIQLRPRELMKDVYRFVGVDEAFQPDVQRVVNQGCYDPMPPRIRADLREVYREQIEQLSNISGRDLSGWLA